MGLAHVAAADVARLQVQVLDADGLPVADAVVSLHAYEGGGAVPGEAPGLPAEAVIEQVRGEFNPRLLVVRTGTPVRFPNLDRIRHHVYSFSPAKVFELPLYSGEPHEPVVFDTPGVVTLGCNIHDWMLGHVVVLDTPLHALSDASGMAVLEAPTGTWSLRVWHRGLPAGGEPPEQEMAIDGAPMQVEVVLDLSSPVPAWRGGRGAGEPAGGPRP